jgi:2-methylcitrate dehydratase PrpD
MGSGATHTREVRYPKGHAKSPMSEAEIEAKFHDLGARRLSQGRRDEVLAAIADLEKSDNVGRDLVRLLAC